MRRSSTWILAIAALTATALIVACSTKYSSSSNGLIVVPVQGGQGGIQNQNAPIMQSFSLDLGNGHVSQINNVNGPPTGGLPTSVVLDPGRLRLRDRSAERGGAGKRDRDSGVF